MSKRGHYVASEYRKTSAVLSGLFATLSVVSLVNKYLSFGLAPIALDFMNVYRKAIGLVMDPLLGLLPFTMPGWYKDAFVLSFVLLLLEFRAVTYVNKVMPGPRTPYLLKVRFLNIYLAALLSLFLVGVLAIVAKPVEVYGLLRGWATPHQRVRGTTFLISFATTFVASVAFFALNSL